MTLHNSFFSKYRRNNLLASLSVLLALACCSPSWAQMGSAGTVNVLVLDPTGAVVQGAKLVLQDRATNASFSAETQEVGSASFASVVAGTYKLTVTKTGFQTELLNSVVVQAGRVTDVKVQLKTGAITETVVVDASETPLVEQTSTAISSTIDIKQIEDLPLQARDMSQLAFITPGFTGTPYGGGTWNGLPVIAQTNTIDGIVSSTNRMKFAGNAQPGLEARVEDIQEMTVQSGLMDLNQGAGVGAMQVNFITRRGSNDYHGRIFEDFRNTALNANSWYLNANGLKRPPLILNEFGGSVGGHIIKDKLFFFGTFAMAKQPGSYYARNVVLSPLAQQGIYTYYRGSQAGQTVNLLQFAASKGDPTSNAVMSQLQNKIDSTISLANILPGPNGLADTNLETISWLVHSPITRYYPALRVDYNISQKFKMDFSFEDTKINNPSARDGAPLFPGSAFADQTGNDRSKNYIGSLGLNWTVTPTLINQFRGGYYYNAYWYSEGTKANWTTQPAIASAGVVCPNPGRSCSGQGFNLPVSTYYPIYNATDNATWMHKNHAISFGFSFFREQDHYWNAPDGIQNQQLGLAGGDPALNDFNSFLASASPTDRGEAEGLYSTLVGRVSGITPIGSGFPYLPQTKQYATTAGASYNLDELSKAWGLYGQDSFRLNPQLTLNFGLRWDFIGDNHDLTSAYHGTSLADMYGPSGVGNLFKPGVLTGTMNPQYVASSHQYAPWNVTPQPMFGLAWNPKYSQGLLGSMFGGKTVVRAGFEFRKFTEPYQYFWNNASNHGMGFFQYFSYQGVTNGGAGTFTPGTLSVAGDSQQNPININSSPFSLAPAAYAASIPQSDFTWNYYWGGAGFDPHIKQPYVQQWTLGIQRELGKSNVLEVRYLGHRSVHQWIQLDTNEVNIFENGFLKEFKLAQNNLAVNAAHGYDGATDSSGALLPGHYNPSFANLGFAGDVALPIMTTAFAGEPMTACASGPGNCNDGPIAQFVDFTPDGNGLVFNVGQGAAGAAASTLAYPFGNANYICNLIGNAITPCADAGYSAPGAYPLNFFQANPLAASFPGVTQSWMTAGGWGNYHALQVDFRQRQWHGMQFDANYTFSHTLGLQPENYNGGAAAWLGTVNQFSIRNLRQAYGPTTFDIRHVIHAAGTYDLPFGYGKALANKKGALDKVVGGWGLGTIVTWETGLPFQILGGYNTFNDYGDGGFVLNGITKSQLQNAVGIYHTNGPYVDLINPKLLAGNTSANCNSLLTGVCQNTTPGTFGINPWLHAPPIWNLDMSLTKRVAITERLHFSFQAEFLNLFNHPNFTIPSQAPYYYGSTNVQSGAFGQGTMQQFTNAQQNNNDGSRVIELRANISF